MMVKKMFLILLLLACIAENSVAQNPIKQLQQWTGSNAAPAELPENLPFITAALSAKQATEAATLIMNRKRSQVMDELDTMWKNKQLNIADKSMKFDYKIFGDQPAEGRSLFISMHGGGNTSQRANDQQWRNQIGLYRPAEGVYLAPRAPTDTWNLWHETHIDTFFDKIIQAAVIFENVNPDKVYFMGYSAGGDGVYQLAPRMADRLAAAAMMAGHPNETVPLGLRNIGFALHMGGNDSAYRRSFIAREWKLKLDSLHKADPDGYKHIVQIHEGKGHWMTREDSVAVPWMSKFRRNTIPNKIVWLQDDVPHMQYYWLKVTPSTSQTGGLIVASYKDNTINIERNYSDTLIIRLNDKMMNLDKEVSVLLEGKRIFKGKVKRNIAAINRSIIERADPGLVFSAEITIANGQVIKK